MKRINLYFDFEFTSLSPDAQPVSLGIVSDEIIPDLVKFKDLDKSKMTDSTIENINDDKIEILNVSSIEFDDKDLVTLCNGIEEILIVPKKDIKINSKSFYAEFSDFDINRCDDWVKDNVVGKLMFNEKEVHTQLKDNTLEIKNITSEIISAIKGWLEQFQDYEIQFVCDCGTFDWYHLLQLIGEWEEIPTYISVDVNSIPIDMTLEDVCKMYKESPVVLFHQNIPSIPIYNGGKTGLPKLPENISPVPFDLNDLIAIKKGISAKEAFDLNREVLAFGLNTNKFGVDFYVSDTYKNAGLFMFEMRKRINFDFKYNASIPTSDYNKFKGYVIDRIYCDPNANISKEMHFAIKTALQSQSVSCKNKCSEIEDNKHNSLCDAKIIKAIYNKLA